MLAGKLVGALVGMHHWDAGVVLNGLLGIRVLLPA